MNGCSIIGYLMNVEEAISDVGNDEIYTYYETCRCRLFLTNQIRLLNAKSY